MILIISLVRLNLLLRQAQLLLIPVPLILNVVVKHIHISSEFQRVLAPQSFSELFYRFLNSRQHALIFYRGRELIGFAFDYFPQDVSQYLAASRFWEFVDDDDYLEARHRTDFLPY